MQEKLENQFFHKCLLFFHKYFVFQKCLGEELDKAAPLRKGEGNSWQCPFCGQDDFPELTEVWNHFDAG